MVSSTGGAFFAFVGTLLLFALLCGTAFAALTTAVAWLNLLETKRRMREHEQSQRRE
jgi:hypothetical protein